MMTSIVSRGVTGPLADALLEALVSYNADAYRRESSLRRIDELPIFYRADKRAPVIMLVAVDLLEGQHVVSCGTAAAAWAGWHRARGRTAHVRRAERAAGMWHAVAIVDGVTWDPEIHMRRERRAWAI